MSALLYLAIRFKSVLFNKIFPAFMRTIVRAYYHFFHKKFVEYATGYPTLFCTIQIITFVYSLLALAYLMSIFLIRTSSYCENNKLFIAALQKVLRKSKFQPRTTTFITLVTSLIPEFLLNLFACTSSSSKLAVFGFSAITGSGIFGLLYCNEI